MSATGLLEFPDFVIHELDQLTGMDGNIGLIIGLMSNFTIEDSLGGKSI
jgi:hypothetical protein